MEVQEQQTKAVSVAQVQQTDWLLVAVEEQEQ